MKGIRAEREEGITHSSTQQTCLSGVHICAVQQNGETFTLMEHKDDSREERREGRGRLEESKRDTEHQKSSLH